MKIRNIDHFVIATQYLRACLDFYVSALDFHLQKNGDGLEDMSAYSKNIITGVSINFPITDGRLNLGTWQGIYLCEFRNDGGARKVVDTIVD
jgi:thiamine phosphate synthase YjbQ (UPF0047 family)